MASMTVYTKGQTDILLGGKANSADLGSAAAEDLDAFASADQGRAADTAVQAPTPTAPTHPGAAAWLSTALADVTVDPSPASRWPLFVGQEPSAWYADGSWRMIYTTGSLRYTECDGDPCIAANWSPPVTILPSAAAHGYLYQEGQTLYYYYTNSGNGIYLTTAPASAPGGTWSAPTLLFTPALPPGQSTLFSGNICVVKDTDGSYRMFLEMMALEALGTETTVNTWQTWVGPASATLTGFVDPVANGIELTSLRPLPASTVSGMDVHRENGQWVCYYHSSVTGRSYPTQGYRATNTSLAADAWTILDQKQPFIRRATSYDVDQVADLNPARDSAGVGYVFYTGAKNYGTPAWFIQVTRLLPTLMVRTAGGDWVPGQSRDNGALPVLNAYTPFVQMSVPYLDPTGQARVGTWALDSTLAGMQGGWRRVNTSAAMNDALSFDVILAPGTYALRWIHSTGPDHANVNVGVAFVGLSATRRIGDMAGYSATETPNVVFSANFSVVGSEAGRARLVFTANYKPSGSSGYKVGDQGWLLTRTDI